MINLEEKIISLVSTHLDIPKQEINLESNFKDLGAETLSIAELLGKVQEELNIDLEDVNPEKIKSIGQLVNIIANQSLEFE